MAFLEKKYREFKEEDFPEISDISVEQYQQLRETEKCVLIDLRAQKERDVSIIPGALTPEDFEESTSRFAEHTIVTYCTVGYRSGLHAKKLQERNLPVRNLVGGVIAWALQGQKFQNRNIECHRVHVFNKNWNVLPDEYEAVW